MLILRQPCLGRVSVSPARGGWGWAHCELVFPGFCSLAAFPGGLLCLFCESEQQWPNFSLCLRTEGSRTIFPLMFWPL